MPTLKQSERTFIPAPAGAHIARCVGMVSLGTQPPSNPKYKPTYQVFLTFELPDAPVDVQGEQRAMTVGKFISAYLGSASKPSKTAEFLQAWFGKMPPPGFDLAKVVGHPCMLNIVHVDGQNGPAAKVQSISPLPKGVTCPPQVNDTVVYEIEQRRDEVFESLPEWLRKKIEQCEEWQSPSAPPEDIVTEHTQENDVPF